MAQQPLFTQELLEQFSYVHDHAETIEQTLDEFYLALSENRPFTMDMATTTLAATTAMRQMCDQIDAKIADVIKFLDGNPLTTQDKGEGDVQQ